MSSIVSDMQRIIGLKNLNFSPFTPTPVSFETVAGKGLLLKHKI